MTQTDRWRLGKARPTSSLAQVTLLRLSCSAVCLALMSPHANALPTIPALQAPPVRSLADIRVRPVKPGVQGIRALYYDGNADKVLFVVGASWFRVHLWLSGRSVRPAQLGHQFAEIVPYAVDFAHHWIYAGEGTIVEGGFGLYRESFDGKTYQRLMGDGPGPRTIAMVTDPAHDACYCIVFPPFTDLAEPKARLVVFTGGRQTLDYPLGYAPNAVVFQDNLLILSCDAVLARRVRPPQRLTSWGTQTRIVAIDRPHAVASGRKGYVYSLHRFDNLIDRIRISDGAIVAVRRAPFKADYICTDRVHGVLYLAGEMRILRAAAF